VTRFVVNVIQLNKQPMRPQAPTLQSAPRRGRQATASVRARRPIIRISAACVCGSGMDERRAIKALLLP
jgi:hypothetical protein